MTIRTRFAPSPTGYLHIGGARTALFSWLYARHHHGQFVLRIEDTDLARSTPESVDAILQGLAWLGLDYPEKPVYQTQRFARYKEVIAQLLAQGDAYYCYCSPVELEQMRAEQRANKQKPRYDGRCRDNAKVKPGAQPVIRFKNPTSGEVIFNDLVKGSVRFANSELDDLVIARADGTPTYNLTVVVDDLDMGLTHVIRGDDHLNNTPRQINIMQALGATPPIFAHLPMILGSDGSRLSKRHGATSVLHYRDAGYLPAALLNYLVRLGWSHSDQEMFSIEEMVNLFDIDSINKSAATFDPDKLLWLNQYYIKHSPVAEIVPHLKWHMEQLGVDLTRGPALSEVVGLQQQRAKTLVEMATNSQFFYHAVTDYDPKAARKHLTAASLVILQDMLARLTALNEWQAALIHQQVTACATAHQVGMAKVAQPIRVAISGNTVSPSIDVTLQLLGSERTLAAIKAAIAWINDQ